MENIVTILKAEKARLERELKKVNQGLELFGQNQTPTGERRVMSEEAKEKIRAGLQRSREAKLAAAQAAAAPTPVKVEAVEPVKFPEQGKQNKAQRQAKHQTPEAPDAAATA